MKKNIYQAFTFVELIVVITIMAILATIGFSVYQSYLESGRDTNRVVQLSEISNGFEKLSLSSRLPFPESMIEIQVGSGIVKTFAYQGFAGEKNMQIIGYIGGGNDPELGIYPTYMLSENRKDFQLMTFIKDANLLSSREVFANSSYENMFPKVEGSPLGILLEQNTQIPLQMLTDIQATGVYNIMTGTGNLIAYLEDKKTISSTQGFHQILSDSSCKRILEFGKSKGSGEYALTSYDGVKIQAYCDMTTDGGGWTMIMRHPNAAGVYSGPFGWTSSAGSIYRKDLPYSFGSGSSLLAFQDILLTSFPPYTETMNDFIFSYQASAKDIFSLTGGLSKTFPCQTLKPLTKIGSTISTTCSQASTFGNVDQIIGYRMGTRTTGTGSFNVGTDFTNNINNLQGLIYVR